MVKTQKRIAICFLILLLMIIIFPITAFADNTNSDSFVLTISNTVICESGAEGSTEFAYTGKIQTGIKRSAVEGDYWYGKADVVYEGLQMYTDSIEYEKINSDTGSAIDTGIITPNAYGMFSFKLKHNETIKFYIDKRDNMYFYLFEMVEEQYETKAVFNEVEYKGTINLLNGEVIGVGAFPGDMERRHYEANAAYISEEYAPKLRPLNSDLNINYFNTDKTAVQKYCASYSFISNTPEKDLPQEVLDMLPADQTDLTDGTETIPTVPAQSEVSVTGGKWVFEGYNLASAIISGKNILYEGYWSFVGDTITKTYQVTYSFVSENREKEIPQEVIDLLPVGQGDIPDGTEIIPTVPAQREVTVRGGKWVFDGYTFDSIRINGSDISFTGFWSFYAGETKPINIIKSDYSSPQTGSHIKSNDIVHEENPIVSEKLENEVIPDSAEMNKINKTSEPIPLDDSGDSLIWGWVILFLIMYVFQCALSISISSDIHVLRWYAKKKKQMR